jgi:hypothetical protein
MDSHTAKSLKIVCAGPHPASHYDLVPAHAVSLARNDAQHLGLSPTSFPFFLKGDNIPRDLLYSFNVVAVNCLLSFPQAELRHVVLLRTCFVELNLRNTLFAFCLYSTFSPSGIANLLQSITFIIRVTRRLRLYR